jgi:hypothetical protein
MALANERLDADTRMLVFLAATKEAEKGERFINETAKRGPKTNCRPARRTIAPGRIRALPGVPPGSARNGHDRPRAS